MRELPAAVDQAARDLVEVNRAPNGPQLSTLALRAGLTVADASNPFDERFAPTDLIECSGRETPDREYSTSYK